MKFASTENLKQLTYLIMADIIICLIMITLFMILSFVIPPITISQYDDYKTVRTAILYMLFIADIEEKTIIWVCPPFWIIFYYIYVFVRNDFKGHIAKTIKYILAAIFNFLLLNILCIIILLVVLSISVEIMGV
jgi:hypothetical protein